MNYFLENTITDFFSSFLNLTRKEKISKKRKKEKKKKIYIYIYIYKGEKSISPFGIIELSTLNRIILLKIV